MPKNLNGWMRNCTSPAPFLCTVSNFFKKIYYFFMDDKPMPWSRDFRAQQGCFRAYEVTGNLIVINDAPTAKRAAAARPDLSGS
jgi:hypothetical protein